MLLHMFFSTRCRGWSLGKPGSGPFALCRECYSVECKRPALRLPKTPASTSSAENHVQFWTSL